MKSLVKSLLVLGRKVPVKRSDLRDLSAAGAYCPQTKTIFIESTLKPGDFMTETLLHELFHAAFDRVSLGQSVTREIEEIIVDQMAVVVSENFTLSPKKKK